MKQRPAIHGRDHRPGGEDPIPSIPISYPVTLTVVDNTTTYLTFLEFDTNGMDVDPNNTVYVQFAAQLLNGTAGDVQPSMQWVWGDSAQTWEWDTGIMALSPWGPSPGDPAEAAIQLWAVMLQRYGDDDRNDGDGNATVFNPNSNHPLEQPAYEPQDWQAGAWNDIDFTKNQHVELQIKWDVADPEVQITPFSGIAIRQG